MFVYYFVAIEPGPFPEVERAVLDVLGGLPEAAELAYRKGEELRARLHVDGIPLAKTVRLEVGEPVPGPHGTSIPIVWEATGTPGLFPRMEADLVVAAVGPGLTHLALRGRYNPPLGRLGRALDKALLHRVAEVAVRTLVDRLAAAVAVRLEETADAWKR